MQSRRYNKHMVQLAPNTEPEHITHEQDAEEAWVCICGNTPSEDGFYPSDKDGNQIEPVEGWEGLYVCDRCGRIIDQKSLEVIGHKPTL
jgi:hypothetical protein